MPKLRFVHAADLHLDSPFRGIQSEAPENVAETLQRATFDAYDNIIGLCLREQVDALLVACPIPATRPMHPDVGFSRYGRR